MLKILPIKFIYLLSSTSQKITYYSYFIYVSLPIISILFFMPYCFMYSYIEKHEFYTYFVVVVQ